MAWTTQARKAQLPPDWPRIRVRVLRRDRYRCQQRNELGRLCLEPANQVDHIERGHDHALANLQALCRRCHAAKSSAEGVDARGPRPIQARAGERHPGLIG